jgi:hypothetical protein
MSGNINTAVIPGYWGKQFYTSVQRREGVVHLRSEKRVSLFKIFTKKHKFN